MPPNNFEVKISRELGGIAVKLDTLTLKLDALSGQINDMKLKVYGIAGGLSVLIGVLLKLI